MAVHIGVDVGGTFTKAVACDRAGGAVVARAVVPTTHHAGAGVAEGVVSAITQVAEEVAVAEQGPVELVAHSTTQAVNALLEGDTSVVGVLGLGRRPDLKRARKRTAVGRIRLAPGRELTTRHAFVDITQGFDDQEVRRSIHELVENGADVVVASEAFSVEDARSEWAALEIAEELGVPACAGHELTGLYGLEMRTVTAALNASILPTALRTAHLVEEAARSRFSDIPLLVMRGDGGVAHLDVMKRHPLLTAFSGPAASVAGALRRLPIEDAVVIEVGGTSTNVAVIKGGRPVLSYVRVLDHVTSVRSVDVRVVGVAGGSLIRVRKRLNALRVADVGPRSAHIAGLPYACFADPGEIVGATAALVSPRPGDPSEYLVLETRKGHRLGLTPTCAANALDEVPARAYARADAASAKHAFEIAGRLLGLEGAALARAVLDVAVAKICRAASEAVAEHRLAPALVVGLGGGAGALVPAVSSSLGVAWEVPPDAEVISSVGDAQSVVRVEVERTMARPTADDIANAHHAAEAEALAAGAAPGTIQLESQSIPERGALRVTAYGAVALQSGAVPSRPDEERVSRTAKSVIGADAEAVFCNDFFAVFRAAGAEDRPFAVVDRSGTVVMHARGKVFAGSGSDVAAMLESSIPELSRYYGPIAVAPAVRIVRGARVVDLTLLSNPDAARDAALAECALASNEDVVALLTRN